MREILRPINIAAVLLAFASGGCAIPNQTGASPLTQELRGSNLQIPRVVELRDVENVCRQFGVVGGAEKLIAELNLSVKGDGDSQFIDGNELIARCGPECTSSEGLGELIRQLAIPIQRR